jgi:DNA-binding CsgD family transcriptional regulator
MPVLSAKPPLFLFSPLEPQLLLKDLNEIHRVFDSILEKNHCTRIKTIGDTYMAVCGMPKPNEEHAFHIVKSAIDIISYLKNRNNSSCTKWEIRIGVHTGKVNGAISGVNNFIYDIFGDTIKVASRMEANSLPMRINVSEITYQLVKDNFTFQEKRPLFIQGKGEIKMYFVADERQYYPFELSENCKMLSQREAEIVTLICHRMTVTQIAAQLEISPRTVESYLNNIYKKLQVKNKRQLVIKILKTG